MEGLEQGGEQVNDNDKMPHDKYFLIAVYLYDDDCEIHRGQRDQDRQLMKVH